MRDVDRVSDLLPEYSTIKWIRKYHELPPADKVHPFDEFMKLLDKEREAVTRLAKEQQINSLEENVTKIGRCKGSIHQIEDINSTTMRHKYCKWAYPAHRKDNVKHSTEECKEFQKLCTKGKQGKYELLNQVIACFNALETTRSKCPSRLFKVWRYQSPFIVVCIGGQKNQKNQTHVEGGK